MKHKILAVLSAVMLLAACSSSDAPEFTQEGCRRPWLPNGRPTRRTSPISAGASDADPLPKGE